MSKDGVAGGSDPAADRWPVRSARVTRGFECIPSGLIENHLVCLAQFAPPCAYFFSVGCADRREMRLYALGRHLVFCVSGILKHCGLLGLAQKLTYCLERFTRAHDQIFVADLMIVAGNHAPHFSSKKDFPTPVARVLCQIPRSPGQRAHRQCRVTPILDKVDKCAAREQPPDRFHFGCTKWAFCRQRRKRELGFGPLPPRCHY